MAVLRQGGGMPRGSASYGPGSGQQGRPELADIGRLARRMMQRTVAAARAEEEIVGRLLAIHLGTADAAPPVAKGTWPAYDQINVQTGVSDAHMKAALDQLLDTHSALTRVLLGGGAPGSRRRSGGEGGS